MHLQFTLIKKNAQAPTKQKSQLGALNPLKKKQIFKKLRKT